jgi:6-phosphogluconolactonase
MSPIPLRRFKSISELNETVTALLKHNLEAECPFSHAVMLSGGQTPFGAYRRLAEKPCIVSSTVRLMFSDERLVPVSSADSNFGNSRFLVEALRLEDEQIICVNTGLKPEDAADDYERQLRKFLNSGGRITLGLLGLGADGHTASLFNAQDLGKAAGRYVVATVAPDGVNRVSVTPDLLNKIQQIIVVASGSQKKEIVQKIVSQPACILAGMALARVKRKQLWFAE